MDACYLLGMADDVLSLIPAILNGIRDDIRGVRDEVRATNTRIDAVHVELRTTRTELTERIDANTRELIRHATAIVDLEKGQREILTVLKEHSRVLQEHTSALALLIRKSDEQGARIDNVLLGVPGQTMRDVQRRVALIEQKLGLVG
jgi:tRNA threonylcarbamoyladenosine modification (KEOPS) complex Cgi121 subunit